MDILIIKPLKKQKKVILYLVAVAYLITVLIFIAKIVTMNGKKKNSILYLFYTKHLTKHFQKFF